MLLRNLKRYRVYDSSSDESDDSLRYSDSSSEETEIDNLKTPKYSFLNKKSNVLKIRQNPDESFNRQCYRTFSYPNFNINLNNTTNTTNTTNKIDLSVIDNIRENFKNVMFDIQKGELNITTNNNEYNNFENRERTFSLDVNYIDYINDKEHNSRERTYSLDIDYVEECIRNGTI